MAPSGASTLYKMETTMTTLPDLLEKARLANDPRISELTWKHGRPVPVWKDSIAYSLQQHAAGKRSAYDLVNEIVDEISGDLWDVRQACEDKVSAAWAECLRKIKEDGADSRTGHENEYAEKRAEARENFVACVTKFFE